MNYDEFAFFNQQLAVMLREGIPLEGALKELSSGMKSGALRAEIELLENDLARGTPARDALARRRLPQFYAQMVQLGIRSNDLPGVLTMLADYYHRASAVWHRLKGLLVYPAIVIVVSLGLTLLLSMAFKRFLDLFADQTIRFPYSFVVSIWIPPVMLVILLITAITVLFVPGLRARMRWRLPPFREASLAHLASSIALMLKSGTTLSEALALAQSVESNSPAGRALGRWRELVESGHGKPGQWSRAIDPFPPMFVWLIQKGGEDVAGGFEKAAAIYHARASYRIDLALYGALPVSVLLLGIFVFWQVAPFFQALSSLLNSLGGGI